MEELDRSLVAQLTLLFPMVKIATFFLQKHDNYVIRNYQFQILKHGPKNFNVHQVLIYDLQYILSDVNDIVADVTDTMFTTDYQIQIRILDT